MKYKSCNLIQHGLCFFNEMLVSCCFSPCDQINGQTPPVLFANYKGEVLSPDFLFERIDSYANIFRNGGCPKECTNCCHIEEKDWDEEHYINSITITHFSICNADCIYCSNNLEKNERTNSMYDIIPVLTNLKEKGVIRKGCEFHIGGGEFTIYHEADEMLKTFALTDFATFYVPTNAIKYNENLFQAMNNKAAHIIVSLDSGTRKTFKKIKRIDAFNQVISNLKLYSRTPQSSKAIGLKYIVIPSINDNFSEFKKFMKIAKEANIGKIIIDIDARYTRLMNYNIDPYLISFAERIRNAAKKQGFITEAYSFFSQCKHSSLNNNNNIFEYFISYIKYKFFNSKIRKLYLSRLYGTKRKNIK